MVARLGLLFVLTFAGILAATESYALCYCNCTTDGGAQCIVSVPDNACRRAGTSLCRNPTQRCKFDCSNRVERPLSCSPLRRCSVRL